jgi:hypothetical protein
VADAAPVLPVVRCMVLDTTTSGGYGGRFAAGGARSSVIAERTRRAVGRQCPAPSFRWRRRPPVARLASEPAAHGAAAPGARRGPAAASAEKCASEPEQCRRIKDLESSGRGEAVGRARWGAARVCRSAPIRRAGRVGTAPEKAPSEPKELLHIKYLRSDSGIGRATPVERAAGPSATSDWSEPRDRTPGPRFPRPTRHQAALRSETPAGHPIGPSSSSTSASSSFLKPSPVSSNRPSASARFFSWSSTIRSSIVPSAISL